MSFVVKTALVTAGVVGALPAFAWGDKAAADWVARNTALVEAINQPIGSGSGERILVTTERKGFSLGASKEESAEEAAAAAYINGLATACDGLTGEHIKNGGKNMPTWAQTAQQRVCLSVSDLKKAYKDDQADKGRCKSLDSAISNARKAAAPDDPEAVVASAASLIAAAESLRSLPILLVQKSKLLGDGSRTFACK